jgi:hypothetical protein
VHCPWQWAPQLALQEASHCVLFAFDAQDPWQVPEQSASQDPWQSKLPGFAMQLAVQLPLQFVVQFTSAVAMHIPLHDAWSCAAQAASKWTGVQLTVQPPDVSSVQFAFACTSMLPHDERRSARATRGAATRNAPKTTAKAGTKRRFIR